MSGFAVWADIYRELLRRGEIDKTTAEKEIRINEFLASCDNFDICLMVDSSEFNDVIKAYVVMVAKRAGVNDASLGRMEVQQDLLRSIELDKIMPEKEIRVNEFLASCDQDDICRLVDSSAFNPVIKSYVMMAAKRAGVNDHTIGKMEVELGRVFNKMSARQVIEDGDDIPEEITRYIISEASMEVYPECKDDNPYYHLYEGMVLEESHCSKENVVCVFKTEEEGWKAIRKFESAVSPCGSEGRGLKVTEYYLYERTFDLKSAIKNEEEVNSEEDFDRQLKEGCFSFNEFDYISDFWNPEDEILQVSPMNIVVAVFDEENIENTEKYVLFHNYNDAKQFDAEFMDMCDEIFSSCDNSWGTEIFFDNRFGVEGMTVDEFNDWFNDYNGLEIKKKQEVKCRL